MSVCPGGCGMCPLDGPLRQNIAQGDAGKGEVMSKLRRLNELLTVAIKAVTLMKLLGIL